MNYGTWGDVTLESQDESAKLIIESLRRTVDVEVVQVLREGLALLRERRFDAVVFRSRGTEGTARRLKREEPDVRVVVLSGFPPIDAVPDPELIWVDKTTSPEEFTRAVLGG